MAVRQRNEDITEKTLTIKVKGIITFLALVVTFGIVEKENVLRILHL